MLTTATNKIKPIRVTSEEVALTDKNEDDLHGKAGHNSGETDPMFDTSPAKMESAGIKALRLFIERIERLEEERKGIGDDVRDVYSEAKSNGYDTKTMRKIVALRKMEAHTRQESDALLETYREALGLA